NGFGQYLKEKGINRGDDTEIIKRAKREYRKEYTREYKKERRKIYPEVTVSLSLLIPFSLRYCPKPFSFLGKGNIISSIAFPEEISCNMGGV
ncbi:MAG: hypothetical protein AAF135_25640, partial [Bacteroidota bacterium]